MEKYYIFPAKPNSPFDSYFLRLAPYRHYFCQLLIPQKHQNLRLKKCPKNFKLKKIQI